MNCNDILTGFNVIGRSVVPGATAGDLSLLSGLNTSSLGHLVGVLAGVARIRVLLAFD